MICPICFGRKYDFKKDGNSGYFVECKKCHGTGIVESQTEQEYLQSCNTEQLAEAILLQWIHGAYHGVGEFGLTDKEIESARDGIIEWLKEIHK